MVAAPSIKMAKPESNSYTEGKAFSVLLIFLYSFILNTCLKTETQPLRGSLIIQNPPLFI